MGTAAGGNVYPAADPFCRKDRIACGAVLFLTVLMIWKVLVPLYLKGWDPVWVGLAVTLTLTVLIIALVYGFDRRCIAAVSGSFMGILVAYVMGSMFTGFLRSMGLSCLIRKVCCTPDTSI